MVLPCPGVAACTAPSQKLESRKTRVSVMRLSTRGNRGIGFQPLGTVAPASRTCQDVLRTMSPPTGGWPPIERSGEPEMGNRLSSSAENVAIEQHLSREILALAVISPLPRPTRGIGPRAPSLQRRAA